MRSTHRLHPPTASAGIVLSAMGIGFLVGVLCPAAFPAAGESAVLLVPASKAGMEVAVPLPEGMKLESATGWQLVEIDKPAVVIVAQPAPATAADGLPSAADGLLLVSIPPRPDAAGPRRFRLSPREPAPTCLRFKQLDQKSLGLFDGDKPVFAYNHGLITNENVPASDSRRNRGTYLHPLWGLNGEVLTDDFPRDHYHHHGVFWSWPHVGIEGKEYNLWMYDNIQDNFIEWLCRRVGPVAAVLGVENGWFVGDKKVMVERVWFRTYRQTGSSRTLDIEFTYIPTDRPVTLWGAGGKSYGGLTVRFAPTSRKDTVITVPGGRTKEDLPDTRLAWADFTTRYPGVPTPSGAAVFIHPNHPDYPPSWLTRHYGPLCVGWPGVKPMTFEPGKPIRLDYRIWIHKAAVETSGLQQAYDAYAAAAKVRWERVAAK